MSPAPAWWKAIRIAAAVFLGTYLWHVLPTDFRAPAIQAALLIAPLYVVAHLLRSVRLFLILYDGRLRLREALYAHVHSAGVSALIPFKLGELYRMLVIYVATGHPAKAVVAAWIERVFDTLIVLTLFFCLGVFAGPQALAGARWFLPVAAAFLFASFFLFLVLPESLTLIKRHLILKHNNQVALNGLVLVDRLHRMLAEAATIWRSRFATMLWLSLGIWFLEGSAVFVLVASLGENTGLAQSSARILTHITVGSSPWIHAGGDAGMVLLAYRFGTVDLLAVLALAIAAIWRTAPAASTPGRISMPELQWA
jgi:hypothetical protein